MTSTPGPTFSASTSTTCDGSSTSTAPRRRSRRSVRSASGWPPMLRRLWPESMRARLALASSLVALAVIGASFVALHERTGTELRGAIDERLRADLAEFHASPAARATTPSQLASRGRRFVEGQGYHTDSRIFVISAAGEPVSTNESELVSEERRESAAEREREPGEGAGASATLLRAPEGLSSIDLNGGGVLRVLTEPVVSNGRELGSFRVAESLDQVGFAQQSLRDTLLVVGGAALAVLV